MKPQEKLKGADLEARILIALNEICSSVPFLKLISSRREVLDRGIRPDLVLDLSAGERRWEWIVECKLSGQPKELRTVLPYLRSVVEKPSDHGRYAILAAPFLSEESRRLCTEVGIGYVDLAGNVHLSFDQVFIEMRAQDNPFRERRSLRSLFSAKAGRILRILLTPPLRAWKVKDLEKAAGVSLGQVSNVRKLLLEGEWAEVVEGGILLSKPEALARSWIESYEPALLSKESCYTMLEGSELDNALRIAFKESGDGVHAVLASYSAARWFAPYARQGTLYLYADRPGKEILKQSLGLRAVESGGNVVLLEPREDDIFSGRVEAAPGLWCSGLVQTWLDLSVAGDRGVDAAEVRFQQKLVAGWRESAR